MMIVIGISIQSPQSQQSAAQLYHIQTDTAIRNLLPVQLVTVFLVKEVVKPLVPSGRNHVTVLGGS